MNRATGRSGVSRKGSQALARMRNPNPRGWRRGAEVCQPAMPDGVCSQKSAKRAMEAGQGPFTLETDYGTQPAGGGSRSQRWDSLTEQPECHMYLGRSQQQQVPVLDFQAEHRTGILS